MKPLLLLPFLIAQIPSFTYYERPPEVYREVVGIVSAYTASEEETDSRPREMANGEEVFLGAIACPPELDFETRIVIEEKEYICSDRMAKKYRDMEVPHWDIYKETKSEALEWGRKEVSVFIYETKK